MNKDFIIDRLNLQPHPLEGGFFARTYESNLQVDVEGSPRLLASCIYYLLTDDSPIGHMHRNRSDIVHCFHAGNPIRYTLIGENGEIDTVTLGARLDRGELPQLIVGGGQWKIAELTQGDADYALLSEVVVPGFEYADNELANPALIREIFPKLYARLAPFIAE